MFRRRALNGFTLIELLVVVSIIALLIAILLPSLSRARKEAKRVVCLSNLRSVSVAMQMYASDYDDPPNFRAGAYASNSGGHYDIFRPHGSGHGDGWLGVGLLYSTSRRVGPWDKPPKAGYLGDLDVLWCPSNKAELFDYERQKKIGTALRAPYVYRNPEELLSGATGRMRVYPKRSPSWVELKGSERPAMADNPIGTDNSLGSAHGWNPRAHRGYNLLYWAGNAEFLHDPDNEHLYGWGADFNRLWWEVHPR